MSTIGTGRATETRDDKGKKLREIFNKENTSEKPAKDLQQVQIQTARHQDSASGICQNHPWLR